MLPRKYSNAKQLRKMLNFTRGIRLINLEEMAERVKKDCKEGT